MLFSQQYIKTASIGALFLSLILSSTAFAGQNYCRELSPPDRPVEEFRKTGDPEQYGLDIIHSSFWSNIKKLVRQNRHRNIPIRVAQVGAANSSILMKLSDYFIGNYTQFYGLGVMSPGNMPQLTYRYAKLLKQKNIELVEGDISQSDNSLFRFRRPRQSNSYKKLDLIGERNRYNIVLDCIGTFSNAGDVTTTLNNSLDILKIGGTYYLTIPWKLAIYRSIPVANNWLDVLPLSQQHNTNLSNNTLIRVRDHLLSSFRKNIQSKPLDIPRVKTLDYAGDSYGFSLAINPSKKPSAYKKDDYYLLGLVWWLTNIEGVDVHIQTSNQHDADLLNEQYDRELASKAKVNKNYRDWSVRYDIENIGLPGQPIFDSGEETEFKQQVSSSDTFYYDTRQLEYLNIDMHSAIYGGFTVLTDRHGQRYYQLMPNELDDEISLLIASYAGNDREKDFEARKYLEGREAPSLAGSEFATIIYQYQKQYNPMLFIKLVKTSDDIKIPVLTPKWTSKGEPVLRNFESPDFRADYVENIDNNNIGNNGNNDEDNGTDDDEDMSGGHNQDDTVDNDIEMEQKNEE